MKTKIIILLLASASIMAWGLDFGVDLGEEASTASTSDNSDSSDVYHEISALMWLRKPVADGTFSLRGGGVYTSKNEKAHPSLTSLKWTGFLDEEKRVILRGGRIASDDMSKLIGRSPMDGVGVTLKQPRFTLSGSAGYTGFLFNDDTSVIMSANDLVQLADDDEVFGVPRILATVSIEPVLFERHKIGFELFSQTDMWESLDGDGKALNTQYASVRAEGAVAARLYYAVAGSLGIAERSGSDIGISGAGSGSLTWIAPKAKSFRLSAGLAAATGDSSRASYFGEGDPGSQFFAVVPKTYGQVLEAFAANNLIGSLLVSVKPANPLYVQASLLPIMRLGDGAVNYTGSAEAGYTGTEADFIVSYAPTSDVRADLKGGFFIPRDGAFVDGYDSNRWELKAQLTLAF